MTTFFGILCAKGGVGKTTTTINLASAFVSFGRDVIIVDADLTAPNLSIHLGVPTFPRSIHDALAGEIQLSECLYFHPSGLRLVPGNIGYEHAKTVNLQNFYSALQSLKQKADIVLVDGAPGITPEAYAVIQAVDYIITITTPDLAAVSDTRKTIKMVHEAKKEILGVIVNRVRGEEHELPLENIQAFLDIPVLGTIPEDSNIRAATQLHGPVLYTIPDAPVTHAYKRLAAKLIGQEYTAIVEQKKIPSFKEGLLKGWRLG